MISEIIWKYAIGRCLKWYVKGTQVSVNLSDTFGYLYKNAVHSIRVKWLLKMVKFHVCFIACEECPNKNSSR